jgi:hypothetical protein
MGALIRTKGTKRLIAHFNDEFSSYIGFYRDAAIMGQFDITLPSGAARNVDLLVLTYSIKDPKDVNHAPRYDHRCLLPQDNPKHAHLIARWLWFLNAGNADDGALAQRNHNKIAGYIFKALNDVTYSSIVFDAVEASVQDVVFADESDGSTKYMKITLQTPAMPTTSLYGPDSPLPIDP